jgi:mannose-6-phosphate isomerase-like protein (cupin superfamily)
MNFSSTTDGSTVFSHVRQDLEGQGFRIIQQDLGRPWGGFFVLDESQAPAFIKTYFPHLSLADFAGFEKLSPKILIVAPHKRLSWQYHHRRAEIWKVVGGTAGVVVSDTDEETPMRTLPLGSLISLKQGERHRLVGVDEWGIIAEIWQHTDREHPSDESDIVRVQDDFGR